MKTIKKSLLALLLVLPFIINGCTSESDLTEVEQSLVGTWESTDQNNILILRLKNDGTGDITEEMDGKETDFSRFQWSATDKAIRLDHEKKGSETLSYSLNGSVLICGGDTYHKK